MHARRLLRNVSVLLSCAVLGAAILCATGCGVLRQWRLHHQASQPSPPPEPPTGPFQVTRAEFDAPAWLPPAAHKGHFVAAIHFNRPVKRSTVELGKSLLFLCYGLTGGVSLDCAGKLHFSQDNRSIAFISHDKARAWLTHIGVAPADVPKVEVHALICACGTPFSPGNPVLTDQHGNVLDGDKDGNPGGIFQQQGNWKGPY